MQLICPLLLLLLISTNPVPIAYGFSSRILKFSETILTQSATVSHYSNPMILYCLTSISIYGYFSFFSSYKLLPSTDKDKDILTISINLSGTATFNIGISYIHMEAMPNMEIMLVNLTQQEPTISFDSLKKLTYDENTYLSAHLTGFSSSKITYNTFYHTWKSNITYTVYTKQNLKENQWVSLILLILQDNYDMNSTICIGSYINSESNVSSARSPLRLDIQPQLHFIIGIEAIVLANAQFIFNRSTNQIVMKETGTYSFSIIVINNTCNYVFDQQAYEQRKQQNLYFALMITFMSIFVVLAVAMAAYFKSRGWWEQKIRQFLRNRINVKNKRGVPKIKQQKSVIREDVIAEGKGETVEVEQKPNQISLYKRIGQIRDKQKEESFIIKDIDDGIDCDAPESNVRLKSNISKCQVCFINPSRAQSK